jgi:hypothetical protein
VISLGVCEEFQVIFAVDILEVSPLVTRCLQSYGRFSLSSIMQARNPHSTTYTP